MRKPDKTPCEDCENLRGQLIGADYTIGGLYDLLADIVREADRSWFAVPSSMHAVLEKARGRVKDRL